MSDNDLKCSRTTLTVPGGWSLKKNVKAKPDIYFTQAQYDRLQELLTHRDALTEQENTELDALVDAELEATIARTAHLLPTSTP